MVVPRGMPSRSIKQRARVNDGCGHVFVRDKLFEPHACGLRQQVEHLSTMRYILGMWYAEVSVAMTTSLKRFDFSASENGFIWATSKIPAIPI